MERNINLKSLQKIKDLLQKYFPFVTVSFLGKRILSVILILLSSTVAYASGYLFLWGYYFGGVKDQSLLSVAVNFVPINNVVAFSVGFFYILLIGIVFLFFWALFKDKPSYDTVLLITLALGLTNLVIVYFWAEEVEFMAYLRTILLWVVPLFFICIFGSIYLCFKELYNFISYSLYYLAACTSCIIVVRYFKLFDFNGEIFIAFLGSILFIIPVGISVIFMINKIKNERLLKIIKYTLKCIGVTPILLMLISHTLEDTAAKILYIGFIVSIRVYLKKKVNGNEQKAGDVFVTNNNMKPLFVTKPVTFFLYVLVMFFIIGNFIPYYLVQGGRYVYLVMQPNSHQKIEYIWDGKKESINGTIISSQNDTYYISTNDRKLVVLKTKDISIKSY
ncbi:hypothetical protein ABI817_002718 [Bacillus cereus]